MTQKRAPTWLQDRGQIYPPRRPLLTPSWDVKVRWYSSLVFTLGMLLLGIGLNVLAVPWRWLRGRLAHGR